MKYKIFCGSIDALESVKKNGVRGLNPKTHKWEVIDKAAKYQITPPESGKLLATLFSDVDLFQKAKNKGLII